MYEYGNNERTDAVNTQQVATAQQLKNIKKQERKAKSGRFWGKVGTGMAVGLAFGVVAAGSFAGVTRVVDLVFPKKNITEAVSDTKEDSKFELGKTDTIDNQVGNTDDAGQEKSSDEQFKLSNNSDVSTEKKQTVVRGMDVSDIVESAMPCIVSITNKSVQEVISMFGMGVQQYESESAGSGIIIGQDDNELLIVTNNHVVDGANTLTVGFIDDEVYPATVKGTDSDLDLAVVSVKIDDLKEETKNEIKVASIGNSDELEVGQQVVAIGNALGYGQSVTTGIISAVSRDVTSDNIDNPLLQTDAAINPGNSGGALLNMNGELVGINCAKIASTAIEGVGYAIPMSQATPVIETLVNRVTRQKVDEKEAGYIGITGISVDSNTSSAYGVPEGVYIQSVEEDSPAEKAGIVKGDVIRKFDGITTKSINDIRENLDYYNAGETVDIVLYRIVDGEYVEKTISITLGSREGTALDSAKSKDDNEPEEEEPEEDEITEDGGVEDGSDDNAYSEPQVRNFQGSPDDFLEFFNNYFN